MNRIINVPLLFLLVLLMSIFTGCEYLEKYIPSTSKNLTPVQLYHKTWEIIKDEYFDKNYNNVDWQRWEHKYDKVLKTNNDAYVAMETMLESLNDRYTRVLPPEKFAEQDEDIEAKVYGVGIQIAEKDNKIIIVSVLDDTPAKRAKLHDNDLITEVNGFPTKGKNLKEVADQIRGKIGTYVKLTIKRGNTIKYFNVVRDIIKVKSVQTKILSDKICYIRLSSFISQEADEEMIEAINKNKDSSAFILDIRSNYGGLLPNAINIANLFLDKGSIIVSTVDRDGIKRNVISTFKSITDKPLIVLINGTSASASEILSGALKDHHRAILVGEKTFGKGLIQKIFDLPDGSGLNVTVSKYLTPNGIDINEKGISPDVYISLTLDDVLKGQDVQLDEAKSLALQAIKAKKIISKSQ